MHIYTHIQIEENVAGVHILYANTFVHTYSRIHPHTGQGNRSRRLPYIDNTYIHMRMQIYTHIQVKETVRDVCFLHNETLFAAAQRKYVYIYDNTVCI